MKAPKPLLLFRKVTFILLLLYYYYYFIRNWWLLHQGTASYYLWRNCIFLGKKVIFCWCISWHEKLHRQQTFMFWIICIQDVVDLTNCLNKSSKWDAIHPAVLKELESEIVKMRASCVRWVLEEEQGSREGLLTIRDTQGNAEMTLPPTPRPSYHCSIARKR